MKCAAMMALVGSVILATACGGEDLAERIAENRIEAEGGGDVDVDFGDGGVSVKTEDGEFSIETDGDGNVSIQGVGENDGDSFSVDSENGDTVIETEDGTAVISQGAGVPDDFPSDVPLPDGVEIQFAQSTETGDGTGFVIAGTSERSTSDLIDELVDRLEQNGFEQQQLTETPDGSILVYQRDDYGVAATFSADDGDGSGFQMTVIPESG